ncbi:MAG: AI-2E family transporter [Saprospiraceae bacterium]|nr:AI-2E family transporter [Saprospiraceae bacterium]
MNLLNRNLLLILGLLALAAIVYFFSDIVAYVLLAWVLSMLGRPLVVFYRKHIKLGKYRMGPTSAAVMTILSFYALITGLLLIFIPTIVAQARNLSSVDYQALGEKLRPMFYHLDAQMHQIGILDAGESLATKTQEVLSNWFKPTLVGDFIGQFLGVAGNIVVTFASVTFILFFFLQDNKLFTDIIHAIVPDEQEQKVQTAVVESSDVLTRYIQGLLIQVVVFALLTTLILWILGVDNALLIGSFGGIFNVIPYVGPILGMIFGGFITLSSNLSADFSVILPLLVKVAAAFMVVQAIDNNFVGPLIMSKSVQAHPLEIFIVTLAAAKIGGVVGMVIGIPVYTVLRVIARNFFSHFKIVQRLTEHLDEEKSSN